MVNSVFSLHSRKKNNVNMQTTHIHITKARLLQQETLAKHNSLMKPYAVLSACVSIKK